MEIREIRHEEFAEAGELVVDAYRRVGGPPVDENGYADELRDVERRAKGAVVLVAVDGGDGADLREGGRGDFGGARGSGGGGGGGSGRVLGCVTYVPDETSPYAELLGPGEAGLRMLAVSEDARRKGVGRALVEACVARARAEGKARLCLHSGEWMHAAHRLYEAMGFRRVVERDWTPEPDIPLFGFVYDLERPGGDADR